MPLATWVAGPYTSTFNYQAAGAVDLGVTTRGYQIGITHLTENIEETDTYGRTLVDQIYLGTNVTFDFECKEYKAGPLRALTSWTATQLAATGASGLSLGTIGTLASNLDGVLILTAAASTPAASSPATLTVTHAKVHENFDIQWIFGPNHRKIPMRMRALPYSSSGIKFFTTT